MSASTTVVPDERIKSAFQALLDSLDIRQAEYLYQGGLANPRTGNKLRQIRELLGEDGYIDDVVWRPVPDESPQIVVRFRLRLIANDGIEFSDGHQTLTVGLARTKFEPGQDQKMFDAEQDLVDYILDAASRWTAMYK